MAARQAAPAVALLAALLLSSAWAQITVPETSGSTVSGTPGTYDPCKDPPSGVQRGDSFVFGLAFWPGSTVTDWGAPYNTTSGAPGLNPCITPDRYPNATVYGLDGSKLADSYQEYLTGKKVVWGTYMVKVDTIAGLRTTRMEMDSIWRSVVNSVAVPSEKKAITVIAFRGQNRSEAQYVVSGSAAASEGTGVVQSLSLMVAWDRGTFNGFTWYNTGPCDTCGGLSSSSCVQSQYEPDVQPYPQTSCAWSLTECACADSLAEQMECPSNNCTSVVYVGHRGSDKSGRTLNSGYQIQQINRFSITSTFWRLLDGAFNLLSNTGIGTPGTGTTQAASAPSPSPPAAAQGTDAALAAQQAAAAA